MSELPEAFQAHLDTGVTSLCRAWRITRSDGVRFGFTDHDLPLEFDGQLFKPDTGLSAMALQQTTGLSVDNTEAIGALSDAAIREADIDAGRFDSAEVEAWLVNWQDTGQRILQFRGNIGEIKRAGGAFQAELRGLTDMLNRPVGRVFQKPCGAVLGDAACKIDLTTAQHRVERGPLEVENDRIFRLDGLDGFAAGWFERGVLEVLGGAAQGLKAAIKIDRYFEGLREITLWEPLRADVHPGDMLRLTVGCDKRFGTCRKKFSNVLNYRGFPDIPEEEWSLLNPHTAPARDGGESPVNTQIMSPERVLDVARAWIGTPYRHQASVYQAGTDCLGLLRGIWRALYGAEPEVVPAYSKDWAEPQGDEVLLKAALRYLVPREGMLRAGDVLLFRMRAGAIAKHIGVCSRAGSAPKFIHAYSGHAVTESPLSAPWQRKIAARFAFPKGV